jgi:hypothetical protein
MKEPTLREVPLANGRFDQDCVPVGNECMYKRHYRKYSRILRQYNRVVRFAAGSSKMTTFVNTFEPRRDASRISKMVSTSPIIPCIICITYQSYFHICTLPNLPPWTSTTLATELQSDSSRPSSPAMNGKSSSASAVAKPPGAQVRCVAFAFHVAPANAHWTFLRLLAPACCPF